MRQKVFLFIVVAILTGQYCFYPSRQNLSYVVEIVLSTLQLCNKCVGRTCVHALFCMIVF